LLFSPKRAIFTDIMRTSYISMRWRCLHCTGPPCSVGIFIVLSYWINSKRVDMWLHVDMLSWFSVIVFYCLML
jgi:hypothetical protein